MHESQPKIFLELINKADINGRTPLHKAAMFGKIEVAEFLINKGAFIDAVDKEGRTPLLLTASRNYLEMVFFFLNNGSDFFAIDSKKKNFLHSIVYSQVDEAFNSKEPDISSDFVKIQRIFEILEEVKLYLINFTKEKNIFIY